MRFTAALTLAIVASVCVTSVQGASESFCTKNKNGTGGVNYQVSKDCCAATREHWTTFFNESVDKCQDLFNGINLGRYVRCCGSRGAGSQGS
ncbi:related to conserved hypothetical Ustilaginaceae-specific protein [Ustilago trichophora]|uniref:Related to conserved hypothetical Ustilaginaceae-specific protein n=1 Tax=Ustilago trichophora TaxID=86804 RepID=A0A5C3EMD7_9BASI|nr:related to conserved hypothetical Ustilaginaceae-specific protein [Ustilago trichophora]